MLSIDRLHYKSPIINQQITFPDKTEEGVLSARDLIYRLTVFASVESSQQPTNSLKRGNIQIFHYIIF